MTWNQNFEQKAGISTIDVSFGVICTNVIMKMGAISQEETILWEEKRLRVELWTPPPNIIKKRVDDKEDLNIYRESSIPQIFFVVNTTL